MRWLLLMAIAAGCGASGSADAGLAEMDASVDAGIPSGNFGGDLCCNSLPACTQPGDFHDCDVGSPLGPYCCTCEPGGGWLCNLYCPPNLSDMSVPDGAPGD